MATHRPMRSCRLEDSIYLKAKFLADKENRSFNNWLETQLTVIIHAYEKENGEIPVNLDDPYQ